MSGPHLSLAPGLQSGDIWPKAANSKWQMGELREDAAHPPSSAAQARGDSPGGGCTHSQATPCPAQAGPSGPTPSGPRRGANGQGLHAVPTLGDSDGGAQAAAGQPGAPGCGCLAQTLVSSEAGVGHWGGERTMAPPHIWGSWAFPLTVLDGVRGVWGPWGSLPLPASGGTTRPREGPSGTPRR